jgi:hypothetical protein
MDDKIPTQTAPHVLSTADAARYLCLAVPTLKTWRMAGAGPPYVRLSPRKCGYLVRDLDAFLDSRRRSRTR